MTKILGPIVAACLAAVLLAGCAGPFADTVGDPLPSDSTADASAEFTSQATVIQKAGSAAMLCLGALMESYPPQCSDGPEITNWTWEGLSGSETASGVTWGQYAVTGTQDGQLFTVTTPPIPLALYDSGIAPGS